MVTLSEEWEGYGRWITESKREIDKETEEVIEDLVNDNKNVDLYSKINRKILNVSNGMMAKLGMTLNGSFN